MSKHFPPPPPPQTKAEVHAEQAAAWDAFMAKVHRGYRTDDATAEDFEKLQSLAGLEDCPPVALASNPTVHRAVYDSLHEQLLAIADCDETLEFLHVTIALDRWTSSDEATVLRLGDLKRDTRRVLRGMGTDWYARIEIQAVTNIRHVDGGRTLCPHAHVTLWGHDIQARAQARAVELNKTLRATFPRAPAVAVDAIRKTDIDFLRIARYAGKAPNRSSTIYVHPQTGRVNAHQSEAGDRYISYLRQFQIISQLTVDQLMFAGGVGLHVRNIARRAAHDRVGRHRGCRSQAVELAEISAFWTRFARYHMADRFYDPQIIF